MTHKIEWHYGGKPHREGCYLVAYTFQYKPKGDLEKKTTYNTCEAVFSGNIWLSPYDEKEIPTVYAWASLPAAPPTKP